MSNHNNIHTSALAQFMEARNHRPGGATNIAIRPSPEAMRDYFRKIDGMYGGMPAAQIRCLSIGDLKIKLEIRSREFAEPLAKRFEYCLSPDGAGIKYAAKIVAWRDDPARFVRERSGGAAGVLIGSAPSAIEIDIGNNRLSGYDAETKTAYFAAAEFQRNDLGDGHALFRELSAILCDAAGGYLMCHAAAVGLSGQGAMLCAYSGGGKSTTALAAMLSGMEMVSDDYLAMRMEGGRLAAYPVYSNGALSKESSDKLKKAFGFEYETLGNVYRKDKEVISLCRYYGRFVRRMSINALIIPQWREGAEAPSILPDTSGRAAVQAVASTLSGMRNTMIDEDAYKKNLISHVKDIRAYRMSLSKDARMNATAIKEFITNLNKENGNV